MNGLRTRSRTATLGMLAALMTGALAPGYVAAATAPITLDTRIGGNCVEGRASEYSTVRMSLKSAAGQLKAAATIQASEYGGWYYCSPDAVVEIGDQFRVNDGTNEHLLIIPELTLVINRVDELFKGRAPAGDYVRLICGYASGMEGCMASWRLRANAEGRWGYKPGWDVQGWQRMSLAWKSDAGDLVTLGARGPHVDVTIGSAIVRGATRANTQATVVLRRAGSNRIAGTAVKNANAEGLFQTKFRNATGKLVNVRVGDRITSNVSPDLDLIVPNVTLTADAAADTITGTCASWSSFAIVTISQSEYFKRYAFMEDDGTFTVDLGEDDVDLLSGVKVRASCFLGGNDFVGRSAVTPAT
jgi:hypothetical protein